MSSFPLCVFPSLPILFIRRTLINVEASLGPYTYLFLLLLPPHRKLDILNILIDFSSASRQKNEESRGERERAGGREREYVHHADVPNKASFSSTPQLGKRSESIAGKRRRVRPVWLSFSLFFSALSTLIMHTAFDIL